MNMIRTGSMFRRRWYAMSAVVVVLAIALTAGTLFAANARQQRPELPTVSQPSVMDATDLVAAAEPPAASPAPERVFIQTADAQEEVDLPPIAKEPPTHPNLDSNLNRLAEAASSDQQTLSEDGGSGATVEPVLVTFYVEADHLDDMRQYLEDNGIFVRNVGEDYIEAHVPPGLLGAASEQPGVLRVDTVIPPRPAQSQTRVISQGVGLHGAGAWHSAGYQGNGVKVGVIDSGFEGFIQLQGSELPSNATARCYFKTARVPSSQIGDCEVNGDHGTAVAETLIDVAPSVDLYIANPVSGGDLRNAVEWMAGNGVKVINISLDWVYEGPGDGKSPRSDSRLKTIDAGVAQGVVFSIAAGNSAKKVWYGTLSDPDNNGQHNFTPQDVGNGFLVEEGDKVLAFMRWDDDWGGADCDLDLLLFERLPDRSYRRVNRPEQRLGFQSRLGGLTIQDGSEASNPFEAVKINDEGVATLAEAGVYILVIHNYDCENSSPWIQLTAWISGDLEHYSPGHHMGNPAETRNPGAMAVGATHWWDTNVIAEYSSRGPTIDGRPKPEITGVACGQSTVVPPTVSSDGSITCWFSGTSQAAPHVAGLAALVRQRFPEYTPEQVVDYLQENASERGPSGADNTWGHGLATLPDPSTEDLPLGPPTNVRVNPVGSGLVSVSWDRAPGAAGYSIIAVNIADTSEVVTKSVNNPDAVAGQIGNLTIGAEYNIYVGSFDANLDFELDLSEKRRVTVE